MLSHIFIKNFALINTLNIDIHNGLQVITGETGAGKSIILGALRLILGERIDAKSIVNSEGKSIVETEFKISKNFIPFFEEHDLDFEENTIIRREILPSGKSRAFVNDVPITLDILKKLSSKLIDIHSQFETANLFNQDYQFSIIDSLCENQNIINEYRQHFTDFQRLKKNLQKLKNDLEEGNKDADYKDFLLSELEEINLENIDFEDLKSQLETQENAETITEILSNVLFRFQQEDYGISPQMIEIQNQLSKLSQYSSSYSDINSRFESTFIELKDLFSEIENLAEQTEINPEKLESLNSIINKINTLLVKHKCQNINNLIEIKNQLSEERNNFSDLESQILETEKQISLEENELSKITKKLSENRKKASLIFKEKMESLLKKLGLEKAKIEVELTENESFNEFGKNSINILFQANVGFHLKPIQSAISGGERSRVMLAIKKIIAETQNLPTLILDEIDTGISGKVAEEIGNLMKNMAQNMQLIVISHLAQVAAKGDHNFKVIKKEINGKTQTNIIALSPEEKLNEIAQLISGSKITDAAIEQAKELML